MLNTIPEKKLPVPVLSAMARYQLTGSKAARRRRVLLDILWRESGHTRPSLVARVEVVTGRGCFGKQPKLTFARDMQHVGRVFAAAGYRLTYRRAKGRAGYTIEGRPILDDSLKRKLAGAIREVSPEQAAIQAALTPAQRVWQGAALSDYLVEQAVRRRRTAEPNLEPREAQRQVMETMYRLDR